MPITRSAAGGDEAAGSGPAATGTSTSASSRAAIRRTHRKSRGLPGAERVLRHPARPAADSKSTREAPTLRSTSPPTTSTSITNPRSSAATRPARPWRPSARCVLSLGVAMNSADRDGLRTDAAKGRVHVFTTTVGPDVSYDSATAGATAASSRRRSERPAPVHVTDCKVEWGTTTAYSGRRNSAPRMPPAPPSRRRPPGHREPHRPEPKRRPTTTGSPPPTRTAPPGHRPHLHDAERDRSQHRPGHGHHQDDGDAQRLVDNTGGNVDYEFEWGPRPPTASGRTALRSATGTVKVSAAAHRARSRHARHEETTSASTTTGSSPRAPKAPPSAPTVSFTDRPAGRAHDHRRHGLRA